MKIVLPLSSFNKKIPDSRQLFVVLTENAWKFTVRKNEENKSK